VNAQSELGGNCNTTANCRVGVCSSGVCCTSACDTACEACSNAGSCESNGACDVFDCVAPNPPVIDTGTISDIVFPVTGTPPAASGGTVRDGRYTPIRVEVYGDVTADTFFISTYEFSSRSVQLAEKDFFVSFGDLLGFVPAQRFAGTFTTSGISMQFDVEYCDTFANFAGLRIQTLQYTANINSLQTISLQGVGTVVVYYTRQ
jgi:hypothetical protein